METPRQPPSGAELKTLLEKLLAAGWIDGWKLDDKTGAYSFHFTAKGRQCARDLRALAMELNLGGRGLSLLIAICEHHTSGDL